MRQVKPCENTGAVRATLADQAEEGKQEQQQTVRTTPSSTTSNCTGSSKLYCTGGSEVYCHGNTRHNLVLANHFWNPNGLSFVFCFGPRRVPEPGAMKRGPPQLTEANPIMLSARLQASDREPHGKRHERLVPTQ